MDDIAKLLDEYGILPASPLGQIITALHERIAALEAEVLPREVPA